MKTIYKRTEIIQNIVKESMIKRDAIDIDVFRLWQNKPVKFAEIKVAENEIIYLNTNIRKDKTGVVGEFPGFNFGQPFIVELASQNIKVRTDYSVSHKIDTTGITNNQELYVQLSQKQQIRLGLVKSRTSKCKTHFYNFVHSAWGIIVGIVAIIGVCFQLIDRGRVHKESKKPSAPTTIITDSINSDSLSSIKKVEIDSLQNHLDFNISPDTN